jgi:hypothetical protein
MLEITEDDLINLIYEALLLMYESESVEGAGDQPYEEIYKIIKDRRKSNKYLSEIFDIYFQPTLTKSNSTKMSIKQAVTLTKAPNKKGNLYEQLENLVLTKIKPLFESGKKGSVIHTGALNNMKADQLISIGFTLNEDTVRNALRGIDTEENSKRVQNILGLQRLHDKLHGSGFLIEVSDKSYTLNSKEFIEEGGFAAQSATLYNFGKTLEAYGQTDKMQEILFALSNMGDKFAGEDRIEEASKYLSTYIAYFLFDDIDMDKNLKNNDVSV